MKKSGILAGILAAVMMLTLALSAWTAAPARAAEGRVVTIGADLSTEQRASIFQFFGTTPEDVTVLIITNADEREHLGHLIPSDVIGWQTFSCAYVAPTDGNGIQVKTANMNYVTGNMIASTLATSGVVNCDVLAAAPFEVSGTGALTGVMMAYEQAIGAELDPAKKELANEELVTTGEIAQEIGQDEATLVVNDIKIRIIRDGASPEDVEAIVNEVVNNVKNASISSGGNMGTLSQDSLNMLYEFGKKVAEMGYDYADMQYTLQRVAQNVTEATGIEDPIMDTFEERISNKISEDSILYTADDDAVGGNTSSTFVDPSESEEVTFEGNLTADGVSMSSYGSVDSDSWVDGTNVLEYRGNNGRGLMDVDGRKLTDAIYSGLYGEDGYITAAIPDGTINVNGVLNTAGETVVPFKYGRVDLENRYWAVCWELTDSTENDADAHDYNDNYYKITSADIYFLENDQAQLAATLTRDEMGEYYANGRTINIQNRVTEEVNCYNSRFEVVQSGLNSVYTTPDSSIIGEIHTFRANGQTGLMDAEGNVIMDPSYYYVNLYDGRDYIEVSTGDKEGLIDWDGNEMIAPEYDSIETSSYIPHTKDVWNYNNYAGNGYVTAIKDGYYVFLDVNGNVTNATSVADQGYDAEKCGASVLYEDAAGHAHILSADGYDTDVSQYSRISPMDHGAGMLYRVQSEDYSYGIIDWHGNVIFEPKFDRVSLSDDGSWLLVNEYYAGTSLFQVSYEGPEYVPVVRERTDNKMQIEIRDEELLGGSISITPYKTFDEEVRWTDSGNELKYSGESVMMDVDGNVLTDEAYRTYSGNYRYYYTVEKDTGSEYKYGLINTESEPFLPY